MPGDWQIWVGAALGLAGVAAALGMALYCRVEDVFVFHKVYGVVRGALRIASRREIDAFLERLQESSSEPLMRITDDFHYHTVAADSEEILDAVEARLGELGLLAPLREYEPEDVKGR